MGSTIPHMASSTSPTSAASPLPAGPGATARTRRAILDAAVNAYAADRGAPLGDIARAAGVGRSTLHRYFADRSALVHALVEDAVTATERCLSEAALDQDSPAEAFQRLVHALFELGPRLNFLFNETTGAEELWEGTRWEEVHQPVGALFVRGQAAGAFDPGIDADWFIRTLWYLLAAGWEATQEGAFPKHRAIALVTRTLRHGLFAPGAAATSESPGSPGPPGSSAAPDAPDAPGPAGR
jgi:AcrR family transcriptional regulator